MFTSLEKSHFCPKYEYSEVERTHKTGERRGMYVVYLKVLNIFWASLQKNFSLIPNNIEDERWKRRRTETNEGEKEVKKTPQQQVAGKKRMPGKITGFIKVRRFSNSWNVTA